MNKFSISLPKYNQAITQLVREINRGLRATDELLSQIRTAHVSHGGATRQVSTPKILETEMQNASVETILRLDWFHQTNVDEFSNFLWELHESFSTQEKLYLLNTISRVTEATGNQFDAQGRSFWDVYIDMIQTTEMSFDERGNHNYQFVVHPDTHKKIMETPPTPEQEEMIKKAIQAKREEYYAQKPTRRLS